MTTLPDFGRPVIGDYAWGSHLPMLLLAVMKTSGRILEIGAGKYSTPALQLFTADREVVTVEPGVREIDEVTGDFDVVLVDGGVVLDRQKHIKMFRHRGKVLVVHDTEDPQYRCDFSGFQWTYTFKGLHPWTTLASNYYLVHEWITRLTV